MQMCCNEIMWNTRAFYATEGEQAYLNYGKQDEAFQEEVSRLIITAQYYGALRLAALRATASSPRRIFLMPLGEGVFNNKSKTIAGAICTAVELLHKERNYSGTNGACWGVLGIFKFSISNCQVFNVSEIQFSIYKFPMFTF